MMPFLNIVAPQLVLVLIVVFANSVRPGGNQRPTKGQIDEGFRIAAATGAQFATPYFGTRAVTAWFDNKYPLYRQDAYPHMVDYRNAEDAVDYSGHNGVDASMYYEPVLAVAPGEVVFAGWQDPENRLVGYGLDVRVSHGNGYATRYGHLSAVGVAVGDRVCAGQIIGTSGNTGNTTGPHLHFDVQYQNLAVDPYGWEGGGVQDPWVTYSGTNATSVWLWSLGRVMRIGGSNQGTALAGPTEIGSIVIDNGDSAFWASTGWTSAAVGYQGDMLHAPVNTGYTAEWRPTLSQPGSYETSVYIPGSNATTWRARFPVTRSLQTQDTLVDEYGTSNLWLRLGTWHMSEGIGNRVSVSSNTGYPGAIPEPAERKVGVDAVRFAQVSPTAWFVPLVARATSMNPLPGTWGTGLQVQNLSTSTPPA